MTSPDEPFRRALATPPPVDETIHPNDFMWAATDPESYWRGARSALRSIRVALASTDRGDPARILDLPSGYGRITRYLRAQWPNAEIVACDVLAESVQFCAEQFGAEPLVSREDPAEVPFSGTVDLIWCGSLLTHLPAERWAQWMQFFERTSHPGTALLFSVHGRFVESAMRDGRDYSLRPEDLASVLEQTGATGFGYADYPEQSGYGVSLTRADWVVRELFARQVWQLDAYAERGLNEHQDVVVATRR